MKNAPKTRPSSPFFSSGPCKKRPGWSLGKLKSAISGRSHRSPEGKARLAEAILLTREVLEVPDEFRIAIVPGSDTGAMEMAMWSLLGARGVDVLAWEAFGNEWVIDAISQLPLTSVRPLTAPYGELPDLNLVDSDRDVIFTWNGTSAGVRVPSADFISADRGGLTICDATSAAFAMPLDWSKLDVVTFSWQKVLGGEAAHGILILGPRAVERLETYKPSWPLPKLFRLTADGKIIESLFQGDTINTPSMLCVEDYIDALNWAKKIGGLKALHARADANARALHSWVERSPWIGHLVANPEHRSNTGVCLSIVDPRFKDLEAQAAILKKLLRLLEERGVAYDINGYRDAPPGIRIWCGATVETADIVVLTHWLDWAFNSVAISSPSERPPVGTQRDLEVVSAA